ncbi:hypothetical protein D3C84_836290 [compost metagenome]
MGGALRGIVRFLHLILIMGNLQPIMEQILLVYVILNELPIPYEVLKVALVFCLQDQKVQKSYRQVLHL